MRIYTAMYAHYNIMQLFTRKRKVSSNHQPCIRIILLFLLK